MFISIPVLFWAHNHEPPSLQFAATFPTKGYNAHSKNDSPSHALCFLGFFFGCSLVSSNGRQFRKLDKEETGNLKEPQVPNVKFA